MRLQSSSISYFSPESCQKSFSTASLGCNCGCYCRWIPLVDFLSSALKLPDCQTTRKQDCWCRLRRNSEKNERNNILLTAIASLCKKTKQNWKWKSSSLIFLLLAVDHKELSRKLADSVLNEGKSRKNVMNAVKEAKNRKLQSPRGFSTVNFAFNNVFCAVFFEF